MSVSYYFYFIIPIVLVLLALKCCLICWRVSVYHKRRTANRAYIQQLAMAQARANAARSAALGRTVVRATPSQGQTGATIPLGECTSQVSLTRIVTRGPDGQERIYIIPTSTLAEQLTRAAVQRASNMPPSYDQAVTGRDRSVKVDDECAPDEQGQVDPPSYNDDDDNTNDTTPLIV